MTKKLQVFDPPMCCSTGVCGPSVDSALVEFAGALKIVAEHGITVERWNLAQQPEAFMENPQVKKHMQEIGARKLPFIYVDDELKLSGRYPTAKELCALLGIDEKVVSRDELRAQKPRAPWNKDNGKEKKGGCCSEGGCC